MGKVFRKSLIGFNRNQVIAYIDAILERHNTVMAAEKDKFKQLSEENEELKARIATLEEQAQAQVAAQEETQQLKQKIELLTEKNNQLQKELNTMTHLLESKTGEYESKLRAAQSAMKEVNTLRNECEQLRQHINSMEKRRTVVVAKPAEKPEKQEMVEAEEISQKTEELWANLKVKIQGLSQEFSQLTADMKAAEQGQGSEKTTKVYSIKEILERIKKIGEKL